MKLDVLAAATAGAVGGEGAPCGDEADAGLRAWYSPLGALCLKIQRIKVLGQILRLRWGVNALVGMVAVAQASCAATPATVADYSEISVSNDGKNVAVIYLKGDNLALSAGDLSGSSAIWRDITFVDGAPRTVSHSVNGPHLIVTVPITAANDAKILKVSLADGVVNVLHRTISPLYAARDLADGSLIYMEQTKVVAERGFLRWKLKTTAGEVVDLGNDKSIYPYVFRPTVVEGSGILFAHLGVVSAGKVDERIEFIPFVRGSSFPLRGAAASYKGSRIACSRDGRVCLGRNQSSEPNYEHYIHHITLFFESVTCTSPTRKQWIRAVDISADGSTVAAIVSPSPRSPARQAELVVMKTSKSDCANSIRRFNLQEG